MTTIYLVRHGETVDNARHIMQGQTHGQLNENGINQAKELRKKLADIHFERKMHRILLARNFYENVIGEALLEDIFLSWQI